MKKILLSASIAGAAALMLTAKTADPVVMTVDGRDVALSEFEYLYNKNNDQQLSPVTFDEYVDMFVNYKLKVADALSEKLDTTASFKAEFGKFKLDLAKPYLKDEAAEEALIQEAYGHTKRDVFVSHIMLDGRDPSNAHRLDSIRELIVNGTITFEDAAREYSVDRRSAENGGEMAWMSGTGIYPWSFEKASYDTPIGEISEVVNSGVGFHLVRPEKERAPLGEVHVRHILLLTRGMDTPSKQAVKEKIDSIYELVVAGADFAEVAKQESQDPGSAAKGGDLGWFGAGRMVAEFDSISFALADGEISKPFETSYGYHIIDKIEHRTSQSLEEMRPAITKQIESDSRANIPVKAKIDAMAAATNSAIAPNITEPIREILKGHDNKIDSLAVIEIKNCQAPAFTVKGVTTTLGEALKDIAFRPNATADLVDITVRRAVNSGFNAAITELEIEDIYATNPDYRNLVNEYRDGIMLFDISNKKVWERASTDTVGLVNYFEKNREKYNTWEQPRFKGYVIFAQNDSTLNEIRAYLDSNSLPTADKEKFTAALKKKFGKRVKVENVIVARGDNPIIDYLGFGGDKPSTDNQSWKCYFAYGEKIIDKPEEMTDVKGAVVTDYQAELEQEWLKELHDKYPVKINKKTLNKAQKK